MGTDGMLNIEENYKVIDSPDLNRFVESRWGKVYSAAKGADAGQNTYKIYDIGLPIMYEDGLWFETERSMEDHKAAMEAWEGWSTSPDPGFILNELVMLGQIPSGKYLLMIWW